eukprot:TRINITY_DN2298_c0_g1_i2.p1 TRINITY_DN2298_c0_g1~~TRINITY_DN2298_c0_g1_i2.p1  ORF type:complete len:505 (-),score=63.82 TRINITY_DN2298_c0_g1_i2:294-1808(-)
MQKVQNASSGVAFSVVRFDRHMRVNVHKYSFFEAEDRPWWLTAFVFWTVVVVLWPSLWWRLFQIAKAAVACRLRDSHSLRHGFLDVVVLPEAVALGLRRRHHTPMELVLEGLLLVRCLLLVFLVYWQVPSSPRSLNVFQALAHVFDSRGHSFDSSINCFKRGAISFKFKGYVIIWFFAIVSGISLFCLVCLLVHFLVSCWRPHCRARRRFKGVSATRIAVEVARQMHIAIDKAEAEGKSIGKKEIACNVTVEDQSVKVVVPLLDRYTVLLTVLASAFDVLLDMNSVRAYFVAGHPKFGVITLAFFILSVLKEKKSWYNISSAVRTALRYGYWNETMLDFFRSERGIEGVCQLAITVYGLPWAIPDDNSNMALVTTASQILSILSGVYGVAQGLYEKELDMGDVHCAFEESFAVTRISSVDAVSSVDQKLDVKVVQSTVTDSAVRDSQDDDDDDDDLVTLGPADLQRALGKTSDMVFQEIEATVRDSRKINPGHGRPQDCNEASI